MRCALLRFHPHCIPQRSGIPQTNCSIRLADSQQRQLTHRAPHTRSTHVRCMLGDLVAGWRPRVSKTRCRETWCRNFPVKYGKIVYRTALQDSERVFGSRASRIDRHTTNTRSMSCLGRRECKEYAYLLTSRKLATLTNSMNMLYILLYLYANRMVCTAGP